MSSEARGPTRALRGRFQSVRRAGLVALGGGALFAIGFVTPPAIVPRPPAEGAVERLLGPIAGLAANVQWVRADLAFRAGRIEAFHSRARLALELAPTSTDGWRFLAWQQAYALGSPEREPDGARRLAWVRAGLATAAAGERRAERPAELALLSGMILVKCATLDPELPWPGGVEALWLAAAEHFGRARAGGSGDAARLAAELERSARAAGAEAGR